MISLRQHVVSLVAVFLALALGLVIGSGFLGSRNGGDNDTKADRLSDQNSQLTVRVNAADGFIDAVGARVLRGALSGKSAIVITVPGTNDSDVSAVRESLGAAGARVSGQLALTDQFVSDRSADKLRTIVDQSIPAGVSLRTELTGSGGRAGDLLGALVENKSAGNGALSAAAMSGLQTLRQGGFIDYTDNTLSPAQLAVIIVGGRNADDSGARGSIVAEFAAAFASRGNGGVLAGRTGSADGPSPVAIVRSNPGLRNRVATVDDVDQPIGRITAVLAAASAANGKVGAYGIGAGARSVTVPA